MARADLHALNRSFQHEMLELYRELAKLRSEVASCDRSPACVARLNRCIDGTHHSPTRPPTRRAAIRVWVA
jgi:hypothetical protein